MSKGKALGLEWDHNRLLHGILSKFPKNTFFTSLIFGIFVLLVVVPLTLGLLSITGLTQMSPMTYSIFKGIWAGALAGIMVWPIVTYALGNAAPAEEYV